MIAFTDVLSRDSGNTVFLNRHSEALEISISASGKHSIDIIQRDILQVTTSDSCQKIAIRRHLAYDDDVRSNIPIISFARISA